MGPKSVIWQEEDERVRQRQNEKCAGKSNKEFNLEAVGFRTYEASLFDVLHKSDHGKFMALIGLTEFLGLSWTHVNKELAVEFLKNYKKKRSPRISLSSSVRNSKITLTKKLIASTFHLSSTGYKVKKKLHRKDVISSLFDPVTARRSGYYIRDCKDPSYFERFEVLNRLICFNPPGQLIPAVLVDVVIRAAIQPVDWAGLLMISLMKELDRVTSSLRQSPSTPVGVHIFLILSNLQIITSGDLLALSSNPYILLDEYSTATSPSSSPSSSLPETPRSGERLAKILHLKKSREKLSCTKSPPRSLQPEALSLNEVGKRPSTSKAPPGALTSELVCLNEADQQPVSLKPPPGARLSQILGITDIFDINVEDRRSSAIPSRSVHKTRKLHLSLAARARFCLKAVSHCLQQCVWPPWCTENHNSRRIRSTASRVIRTSIVAWRRRVSVQNFDIEIVSFNYFHLPDQFCRESFRTSNKQVLYGIQPVVHQRTLNHYPNGILGFNQFVSLGWKKTCLETDT